MSSARSSASSSCHSRMRKAARVPKMPATNPATNQPTPLLTPRIYPTGSYGPSDVKLFHRALHRTAGSRPNLSAHDMIRMSKMESRSIGTRSSVPVAFGESEDREIVP